MQLSQRDIILKHELMAAIEIHPLAVGYQRHPNGRVTIYDADAQLIVFNVTAERAIGWLAEHMDVQEE